jgi:hypothetical protein
MSGLGIPIAAPNASPSPPVGEGIAAGRHNRGWVRGSVPHNTLPRQPLTRLRFAEPSSPTRGEGKKLERQVRQPA